MTQASSTITPILIQHAQVLLPSGEIVPREVMLSGGRITAVGTQLEVPEGTKVINGRGYTLLPGVIDPHVHFCTSGCETEDDLTMATIACVKGGVTSFLEMPDTQPSLTPQATLTEKLAIAAAKSLVNYGFFIGATAESLQDIRTAHPACGIQLSLNAERGSLENGRTEKESVEKGLLSISSVDAIDSVFATGDRLIAVQTENQARLLSHRELCAKVDTAEQQSQAAENDPALLATKTALKLSKKYQRRLHILHVSSGEEANLLRRDKPSWVSADVTPQHLLLDISSYEKLGTLAQMHPPLKYPRDREILWQALKDGVIDFISTDHSPHRLAEKGKGYLEVPFGVPGVETALMLMLTQTQENRCSVAEVSNWMSTAVARAYNIPNKGLIEPGFDADLVLVDLSTYRPVLKQELQAKGGWSPFEGWNLTGWPVVTIVGGQVVYDRGTIDTEVRGKALEFEKLVEL